MAGSVGDEAALRAAIRDRSEGGVDLDRLAAAVAARADREGLIEVALREIDSPVGPLLAAATDRGLVQLSFPGEDHDLVLERLAAAVGPRVLELPARLDPVARQLDEYFQGERHEFELELDWRLSAGFVRRVLEATARIPYGETRSYAEMAQQAGSPRAYRAAGSALGANPIPIVVPCHRVLRSGGALGGYGGGVAVKRRLLALEGGEG